MESTDKHEHQPRTATDEVLHEFEEAELRLDDGQADEDDGEAADSLTPSPTAQESVRPDRGDRPGAGS
ncbi:MULTISPECIES: hypothetical protein [Streptomyces]|uniref:Uncharacterized protein n=2 Tax=Streptomyces TaxID=1883 RepID=A0A100Y9N9_9ACTN|nr:MULTISPECIES: hypothetical protein [Streptomyces]KUH40227.1 hypothetical protein ATE80_02695 [Streptomyces kanasensis]UUS34214.1 hypothetical protein NRO40_27545 [Streptomyces changanensis]